MFKDLMEQWKLMVLFLAIKVYCLSLQLLYNQLKP